MKVTTDELGGMAADTQIIQAYMAMEMTSGQQEVRPVRASKVPELFRNIPKCESQSSPRIGPETKGSVTVLAVLLQNIARELTQLQNSDAAAASGGSGGESR